MKAYNILETIGNTPHVRLNKLFGNKHEVWMKLEKTNPGGSIKDRIALAMIEEAEKNGDLTEGGTIIEPTSGNTGIGLALVGAVKGYRVILVMPESMSVERRKIMEAYGAEFVLTPKEKGMNGSIEKANELSNKIENSWMPMQFKNAANPAIHVNTTAVEIVRDFPKGFDYLVTGVGTGGHITGVSQYLKSEFPLMKVFAVEPTESAVISGEKPNPHGIQGIGAGFIPDVLKVDLLDGTIKVSKDEALEFMQRAAREEGIFVGISSGASLAAVNKLLSRETETRKVLTFAYDTGERYLSIE